MKSDFRPRWLSIFAVSALIFAGIRLAAGWLLPGAHDRLVQQYWSTVRALPEDKAARFVTHLAENDAEWADVIVVATADERPLVASTAERELRGLVLRLARMPGAQSSLHVADLARALAITVPNLPPDRRSAAKSIVLELITWPIDSHTIDAAQFIADCEAVLLLPVAQPIEIRVAAAPPAPPELSTPLPEPVSLPALQTEPTIQPPPTVLISEPDLPPTTITAQPAPNEPQRFVPIRSIRISDD